MLKHKVWIAIIPAGAHVLDSCDKKIIVLNKIIQSTKRCIMKKITKTILLICMATTLVFSVSITASAAGFQEIAPLADLGDPYWGEATLSVPGTNGSATSNNYIYKCTDGETASFVCTAKSEDRNFDARLKNSNGEARSSWARNLDIDEILHVKTTAVKGYQYTCQVSSDLFTIGSVDVTLSFSPDYLIKK